ncbi:MAG: hypothetical protein ISQ65_09155 [Pseudomonadales bacterium]|nr:hypothetical protein [Pseudomonadales bacterium]
MTQFRAGDLHVGRLEQRLERLNRQIDQLSDEVTSLASLADASSFSGPHSIEELGHSLRAEILRLKSELTSCQRELHEHRTKAMSERAPGEPPSSGDTL